MKRKLSLLAILMLIASLVLSSCKNAVVEPTEVNPATSASTEEVVQPNEEVKTVKIGFLNPASGGSAESGQLDFNGARLAVKHINEMGGIKSLGGAKIELVEVDSTSDAKEATAAAERLITTNSDLAAIVGTGFSSLTLSILPILEQYQIAAVTNSSSDDIVKQGYKYIFKIAPLSSDFGKLQVNFIKSLNNEYDLNIKKVGVVYVDNSYGVNTAKGVKDIAESAGLTVVVNQSFPEGFTDASSLVTTLKNSGCDVVFPIAYTNEAKLIYDTMKSMNYNPMIIAGGGGFLWPSLGKALGDAINGTISASTWNFDSKNMTDVPELVKVYEDYEAEYGTYMSEHSGPPYMAVWVVKEAIENCASTDPKVVRDAIAALTEKDSPYLQIMQPGILSFDETGFNTGIKPVLIQWQDNKPRTIYPLDMASSELILPESIEK